MNQVLFKNRQNGDWPTLDYLTTRHVWTIQIPDLSGIQMVTVVQLGSEIWTRQKRLVCQWSIFQMGSEVRHPNHLKSGKMAPTLQKLFEN